MAATTTLRLANRLDELERLAREIGAFGAAHGLSAKVVYAVNLSLGELVTNIIKYGYGDAAQHAIEVTLTLADGLLTATLADDGRAFNPLLAPVTETRAALAERRVGGWGIHFVREMMDDMHYVRIADRNVLQLVKKIHPSDEGGGGQ